MNEEQSNAEFEQAIGELDLSLETDDIRNLVFYILDSEERDSIKVLFENGLSMDYTNSEGENLFDIALKNKNEEILHAYFTLHPEANIQRTLRKQGFPLDFQYFSKSLLEYMVLDEDSDELSELIHQGIRLNIPVYDIAQLTKKETLNLIEKSGIDIIHHYKLRLNQLYTDTIREYVAQKYSVSNDEIKDLETLYKGVSKNISNVGTWVHTFYENYTNKHVMDLFSHFIDNTTASNMLITLMGVWSYQDLGGNHPWAELPFELSKTDRIRVLTYLFQAGADPASERPAEHMGISTQWPFKFAMDTNDKQIMTEIANFGAIPRTPDMMKALKNKDIALLNFLITLGGNINQPIKDAFGDGGYGYSRTTYLLHQAVADANIEAVELLLKERANPERMYEFGESTDFGERSIRKNAVLMAYVNMYNSKEGASEIFRMLSDFYDTLPEGSVTDVPYSFSEFIEYGVESDALLNQAYQNVIIKGSDEGIVYVEGTRKNISAFLEDDKKKDAFISKGIVPYHFNGRTTFEDYYRYVTNPLSDRGETYLPPYP